MARVVKEVPVSRFKAQCLALLDEVAESHAPLIVTKRGRPFAKVVPLDDEPPPSLLGSVSYGSEAELLASVDETWEADQS
jgi:prevent-host-death family protein